MLTGILLFEDLYFVFYMTTKQKSSSSLGLSQGIASSLLEKLAELDFLRSGKTGPQCGVSSGISR